MLHEREVLANARIVSADEFASLIDRNIPTHPEHSSFEFPGWIWGSMLASYAIFFSAMFATTSSSGPAIFAVTVSLLYTAMYFGSARLLAQIDRRKVRSFDRRGGVLDTWTGPMSTRSVAAQVLVVPLCVAFFGISIAVIKASIF